MTTDDSKLNLLFGVPEKTARGGINACEPPFISAIRRTGAAASEETYLFDNSEETSFLKRIAQVLEAASRFRTLTQTSHYDVVHLNTSFELRSLLRDSFTLWRLTGVKVFLKFHGSNPRLLKSSNPVVRILTRYVTRKAAALGVLSREEKKAFEEAGLASKRVFVVKNAVEQHPFPHVEKDAAQPKRLLFVSRLVRTKGLEDSVRALKLLVDAREDLFLDVLGSGESKEPAERLAKELGVSERTVFHGHVDEEKVRGFYRSSDILVFPTFHDEGFPMVVFGALQFGIPIVTTRSRASADYLQDGKHCVFCEPHDPESVATSISRILRDSGLAGRIRENNIALSQSFAPDKISAEYLDIYRQVASDHI